VNRGGTLGSVPDMLLAAGGDVAFETLKDNFVSEDYRQRGFLSGITVLHHEITTAEAGAQSLVGDVSILAGYGVCDGGSLCAKGKAPGEAGWAGHARRDGARRGQGRREGHGCRHACYMRRHFTRCG
jgi:hypothetical protein